MFGAVSRTLLAVVPVVEWTIRPHEGAGPVDFNMTATGIARVLGPPSYEQQREPEPLKWLYGDLDIAITFDSELKCDFVGFLSRSVGIIEGIRLVGQYRHVVEQLEQHGHGLREEQLMTRVGPIWSGHSVCDGLGITLRRETRWQEHISDAGAFRPGYWEAIRPDRINRTRSGEKATSDGA